MTNITTLKRAVKATGRAIEIEEIALNYERSINLYLESNSEQFAANECLSISSVYYDESGDRSNAIQFLLDEIDCGFEPISEETKYANGID